MTPITIRPETPEDAAAIRNVNELAFGRKDEADLIDALRSHKHPLISLVACEEDEIVGHILFSLVTIHSESTSFGAVGLGPMTVLPEYQDQGIGSKLVKAGLKECRRTGYDIVVVLGHPEYYPRFGFAPAKPFGISCEYDVPDEAFMILELTEGALAGRKGAAKYLPEFGGA